MEKFRSGNINSEKYPIVKITDSFYQEADKRINGRGAYSLSYRGKDANMVGTLGELAAEKWMRDNNIDFIPIFNTTHDYLIKRKNGIYYSLEIKTKDRTAPPAPNFVATTPLYNHNHQRAHFFLFISLERKKEENNISNFHTAYIVGVASYKEIKKIGEIKKKGERDGNNNMEIKFDCINIELQKLSPPEALVKFSSKKHSA